MRIDAVLVEKYREIDWNQLLRSDLGNAGQLSKAKIHFDRIKLTFDQILDSPVAESLADPAKQKVESQLNSFVNFINSQVLNFSDVSHRNEILTAIRNTEWQIASNLNEIISYINLNEEKPDHSEAEVLFKSTRDDLESERDKLRDQNAQLADAFNKLSDSLQVAQKLDEKTGVIDTAIARAEEWVRHNEKAIQLILQSNATDSAKKAKEHKTAVLRWIEIPLIKTTPILQLLKFPLLGGTYIWILLSALSGLVVMCIIAYFIYLDYIGRDLTTASVLLRLSAVIIPAYFTIFCAQQYLSHRRLYEAYSFKDVTLQTMIALRRQNPNNHTDNEYILKRAVEVIFSEPKMSNEIKYDKHVVTELIGLAKK